MTFYYLKNQMIYHHAPKEMVDKNIRTDYSKLKLFVRLDKATGSTERMSTLQEIEAKGYLYTNIKTSFPADKIANPENYNSLLFYYGLLTIGATRGDMLKMVIPNNCVKEQYFGFMREYYRDYTQENMGNLVELMTDMAFDGDWQPFIKKIANAYRDAQKTKGEGDAEAARVYADAFGKDPQFAQFYRSLEAYRASLAKKGDVLVLDPAQTEFFRAYRGGGAGK